MTNKLKYFIGNWKMFGDFTSLKIIEKIHFFLTNHKKYKKKKYICYVYSKYPNIFFFNKT